MSWLAIPGLVKRLVDVILGWWLYRKGRDHEAKNQMEQTIEAQDKMAQAAADSSGLDPDDLAGRVRQGGF